MRIPLLLYFTLGLSPAFSSAQDEATVPTPGALTLGVNLGVGAASPVVRGKPFSAVIRTQQLHTSSEGVRTLHEAIDLRARDTAGRLRNESIPSAPDSIGAFRKHTVQLIDPVARQQITWDANPGGTHVATLPPWTASTQTPQVLSCNDLAQRGDPGHPEDTLIFQTLGLREIEGVQTEGCRITRIEHAKADRGWSGTIVTERWASTDLQIVLLSDEKTSSGDESVTRISRLVLADPDPTLFRAPEP